MAIEHPRIYYVGEGVADNTPLWRYMRLSTLLTLLTDKLFLPTVATLRKEDPSEAMTMDVKTWKWFKEINEREKATIVKFGSRSERAIIRLNPKENHARLYSKIWRKELGERRCVWCWHAADIESMAQWQIYAKDGVAIRSTPKRIRRALAEHNVDSGLIGEVHYNDVDKNDATFLRPYLIKRRCYEHEKEVRLVLPREPNDEPGGIYLSVDGRELIDEIRTSPMLPHGEALDLRSALEHFVNSASGARFAEQKCIPIGISSVKDISGSLGERFEFFKPKRRGISNFGKLDMPFIFSDDIRRGVTYE